MFFILFAIGSNLCGRLIDTHLKFMRIARYGNTEFDLHANCRLLYKEKAFTDFCFAKRAYVKSIHFDEEHFDKLCLSATDLYRVRK